MIEFESFVLVLFFKAIIEQKLYLLCHCLPFFKFFLIQDELWLQEKLVVVHPAIDISSAHVLYTAYEGWIYSGRPRWRIDKLVIQDEKRGVKSACRAPPLHINRSATVASAATAAAAAAASATTPSTSPPAGGAQTKGGVPTKSAKVPKSIKVSVPVPQSEKSVLPGGGGGETKQIQEETHEKIIPPDPKGKLLTMLRSGIPQVRNLGKIVQIQLVGKNLEV